MIALKVCPVRIRAQLKATIPIIRDSQIRAQLKAILPIIRDSLISPDDAIVSVFFKILVTGS